jgi:RND family efflux transporter MFP subunit
MSKNILTLLVLGTLLWSCAGGANKPPKDAASARKLIQDKKAEVQKLQEEIAELEKVLGTLDTTQKVEKKVLITTLGLKRQNFATYVEVQGNVMTADEPAFASSETGGRIIELKVKEGDFVQKGQLIARVNMESLQKSIDELSKSMELANDIYKRQENLWKQNIGSEVQYLQAKNQVESLQKTKERLEYELSKANVFAPASGYVDRVMSKTGEVCGPGTPIIQILNTNALKVRAAVPENYLSSVRRGDVIRIQFPALDKQEQMGRISEISRTINPANRTFDVDALVESKGGLVKPNLLAIVLIKDFEQKDAIVVPQELVLQDVSGRNYVMIKEGDRAAQRLVSIGKSYDNQILITEGLKGDELLIFKGARQAVSGDLVEVIGQENEPSSISEKK